MTFFGKTDNLLKEFNGHLTVLGVSPNTLRNYRSDVLFFLKWASAHLKPKGVTAENFSDILPFLSSNLASEFRSTLTSRPHSQSTVNRRLSALRALSRFLVQIQILESDFMDKVANLGKPMEERISKNPLVSHFQKHLEAQSVSKNTVKNYVSDIKHFLSWLESNHGPLNTKH